MRRWIFVVAIAGAVACGSKKQSEPQAQGEPGATGQPAAPSGKDPAAPSGKDSAVQTYTIAGDGSDKVKIEVAIPAGWAADTSNPDAPTFKISNVEVRRLTFVALTSLRGDANERLATAIKLQFGDDAGAEREDLPDGRVWMRGSLGTNIHARMFVPYDNGVVMGFALLGKSSADRVPEIRKVFETLKVVP